MIDLTLFFFYYSTRLKGKVWFGQTFIVNASDSLILRMIRNASHCDAFWQFQYPSKSKTMHQWTVYWVFGVKSVFNWSKSTLIFTKDGGLSYFSAGVWINSSVIGLETLFPLYLKIHYSKKPLCCTSLSLFTRLLLDPAKAAWSHICSIEMFSQTGVCLAGYGIWGLY